MIRINDEIVELGDLSPALVIDPHHAESLFHVDVHGFMVGPSMSVGSHINNLVVIYCQGHYAI